jgi:hypothetical protein
MMVKAVVTVGVGIRKELKGFVHDRNLSEQLSL